MAINAKRKDLPPGVGGVAGGAPPPPPTGGPPPGADAPPDDTPEMPASDEEVAEKETGLTEEPLSAQVVRRMHEDASLLLEEYDSWMKILEHKEVKGHLRTILERFVEDLETLEELHAKHHPDLAPLGGGSPDDEDQTEADSGEPERPTADEALEGMEKMDEEDKDDLENAPKKGLYLKKWQKELATQERERVFLTKRLQAISTARVNGKSLKEKEELEEEKKFLKMRLKDLDLGSSKDMMPSMPGMGMSDLDGADDDKSCKPGDEEHQKKPGKAKKPSTADGQEYGFEGSHKPGKEEEDQKKKDKKKGLPDGGEIEVGHKPEAEAGEELEAPSVSMGSPFKDHHLKHLKDASSCLKGLSDVHELLPPHQMEAFHHHKNLHNVMGEAFGDDSPVPTAEIGDKKKDLDPLTQVKDMMGGEGGPDEGEEKALHPHHKVIKGASAFLRGIAHLDSKAFSDGHRGSSLAWHKELDPIANQENNVEMNSPGGMGEGAGGMGGGMQEDMMGERDQKDLPSVEDLTKLFTKQQEDMNNVAKQLVALNGKL